jgi:hypothetical protein
MIITMVFRQRNYHHTKNEAIVGKDISHDRLSLILGIRLLVSFYLS